LAWWMSSGFMKIASIYITPAGDESQMYVRRCEGWAFRVQSSEKQSCRGRG
jgi:hypothetical protein